MVALLASCQPLPHPFADDRPPAELLAIPESAGVSIAPVEGQPTAIAAELGPAIARALLGHEIPASEKTVGRGSYQLYGRLAQSEHRGKSVVTVLWRLENAKRREIGEREVRIEGTADEWRAGDSAMIERLAVLSADAVAPLLVKEPASAKFAAPARPTPGRTEPDTPPAGPPSSKPPLPTLAAVNPAVPELTSATPPVPALTAAANPARKQDTGRPRVALRRVTGAPGDGATSLASAVTSVLRQRDLAIADPGGKADFTIDGEVSIAPSGSNKQHIKIVWRVRNASGAEIGTVGQENDVPRGLLSGAWGDVAYAVAVAAGDGLLEILARAGPPAGPAAGTGADTAAAAEKAPSSKNPEPAASAARTGKSKGKR